MRALQRLVKLPGPDRRLLCGTLVWVVAVRIGLWILPFRQVWSLTRWGASRFRSATGGTHLTADRAVWAVRAASRRVPGASCLTQSLALYGVLNRSDPCVLRFGVAKEPDGTFMAHAWVENAAGPLLPANEVTPYAVFPGLRNFPG